MDRNVSNGKNPTQVKLIFKTYTHVNNHKSKLGCKNLITN